MRILLITPYFYPHKGGSQQYAEEIHYYLMKENPNIEVDVLCYNTDNAKKFEKYRGFNVYRVPCVQLLPGQFALPNYLILWKTLNKLFKRRKYDVINTHTRFFENSWWTPLIARRFNAKSVLTDHCADHPTHPQPSVRFISKIVDIGLVSFMLRSYDLVTVTNKATHSFVKSLSKVNPVIIYGGVDTKTFKKKNKDNFRLPNIRRNFKKDDVVVTFVGRMIPSKAPDILLSIALNITEKNKKVYFVFAGDGPLYKKLAKNRSSQIFFTGALEKDKIATLLSKSDVLVHPSRHNEGFPNVLLEAGASGCAIVATDMGGTNEIITQDTGMLVKPIYKDIAEAVRYLIAHKSTRNRLGRNVRKWIEENYNWEEIVTYYKQRLDMLAHAR